MASILPKSTMAGWIKKQSMAMPRRSSPSPVRMLKASANSTKPASTSISSGGRPKAR